MSSLHHPAAILLPLKPPQFPLCPHSFAPKLKQTRRPITIRPWSLSSPDHHAPPHSAANTEIDMVITKSGVFAPKPKKVVILWDLDNKPPRGPPYQAALALKGLAEQFGTVVDVSAYANRHAFDHLPNWVVEERRERRRLDVMERKGFVMPNDPYACKVCGRKFGTNLELKKHFRNLHEREREKKLSRMRSLKGKKRQRFKERFIDGNVKYREAERTLVTPRVGYGLGAELRRAGVYVKTVEDKPQAADWALKRQMMHSMSRGIDWLVLVSDDSDFADMLRRAREGGLGTVVVGDWDRALGRHADLWVEWVRVENGEVSSEELVLHRKRVVSDFGGSDVVSGDYFDGHDNVDRVVEELVGERSDFYESRRTVSAFSEGEEEDVEGEGSVISRISLFLDGDSDDDEDFLLDSDEESEGGWFS